MTGTSARPPARPSARLGVDIGGTFTDVVLEVDSRQYSTKVLTTYMAPEDAIIQGLHEVCTKASVDPQQISQIIHGTTLATNALIERAGAHTALITTKGFRDVIEMRTESRFEQYDLNLELPQPLLPRQHRYVVNERISAQGETLIALDMAEVEKRVAEIAQAGFQSVAVGLIHAYVDDTHEKMIRDVLNRRLPNVMVSMSSEVSPQMREYERFNTTVANAYIKPLMKSYLGRLEGRLQKEGVDCPIFLMHSGGGIISLESAAEFPVRLVESGPAGGAVFAANIASTYGLDKVLSFDMGGTTAKICLIKNQTPKTSRVFEVARTYRFKKGSGMPISIPVIDMVEIGAGGGSLAHVDSMRQIRVGPQSAGSEPGPACYGLGGAKPAVTDADLVLGKLDPDNFADGTMQLDTAAAEQALGTAIGKVLSMDTQTAAFGLAEVVDENMANAARVHAVENGEDLSQYTMIAFGGAAPLHAGRLCEKLGVNRFLVPPGAGVGSAIGFLRAPFSFEANRSVYMRLSDFDSAVVADLFSDLENEARRFVQTCAPEAELLTEFKVYMRYCGQGWEIPVVLTREESVKPDAEVFLRRFEEDYQNLFARVVEGMDVEITVWSVNATTPLEPAIPLEQITVDSSLSQAANGQPAAVNTRAVFDPALETVVSASVTPRDSLSPGDVIQGPAVITETETTVIVPSSRQVVMQRDGCIDARASAISHQPEK
ncbi:MAG: hydantoinase/oxoprolinase family protein [Granulosicoccus sp.]|nr:hydantoinase/oxoprolinase family protein [Granulosicoccus sp.]